MHPTFTHGQNLVVELQLIINIFDMKEITKLTM